MKLVLRAACLFALTLAVAPADAVVSCTVSAAGVSFGVYNAQNAAPADGLGTVSVQCTTNKSSESASVSLQLTAGSGTFATRTLVSGANQLSYNLYTNSARTIVWGNGTSGTSTVTDSYSLQSTSSVNRNYTVYGRMPAQQTGSSPGTYSDTVTVTLAF